MLLLDGAAGEGGGQILRTALGLSLVTGTPFRLTNIRAGRERPGLRRQHLTAIEAAARIGGASVEGARLHSSRIDFLPGDVAGGNHTFDVGTAGSATLVLQTVLPALLLADAPSRLVLRGGTHNPFAPPFDFLKHVFLPWLRRMGAEVDAELVRPGFFPAGGGEMRVTVQPAARLAPVDVPERGRVVARLATAVVAHLPLTIAERELHVVAKELGWRKKELRAEERSDATGPGNALTLHVEAQHGSEVVTGFGEKGLPAERVAKRAARALKRHLAADVPVGEHLADQILVPLALAGGGSFRTLALSSHARTNAALIERFLPVRITDTAADAGACVVRITRDTAG
ncbi:MAG: RNA 3'-terminal phosphate cyclase [Planctomycetota bacterium]|jgi:RNA 3'-terminal phosphate cyclase (ATP)